MYRATEALCWDAGGRALHVLVSVQSPPDPRSVRRLQAMIARHSETQIHVRRWLMTGAAVSDDQPVRLVPVRCVWRLLQLYGPGRRSAW